jgi:hypothetical protein
MLDVFNAQVVPLLQKRGLFRRAYEGETLRAHYGLERPDLRFREDGALASQASI